jgi:hypothetical protein
MGPAGTSRGTAASGYKQSVVSNPWEEDSPSASENSVVGLSVAEKKQVSSLRGSNEGPVKVRQ